MGADGVLGHWQSVTASEHFGQLDIRESILLRLGHRFFVNGRQLRVSDAVTEVGNLFQASDEPRVDAAVVSNFCRADLSRAENLRDGEYSFVRRLCSKQQKSEMR